MAARLPLHSYRSKAVLLQGRAEPDVPKLFLVSEGSGSAAAYINLPELDRRTSVYGLESPFLRCPEQFYCTMEEICGMYVDAVRTVQPRGPYLLGGWSIGGMYAYEVARQLTAAGEAVHGLLLIESACPRRLDGLPAITLAVCEETGMFEGMGGRTLSHAEKLHVVGCVRAVSAYDPVPIAAAARPPHVFVIWSRYGLFEKLSLRVREAGERMLEEDGGGKTGITHDWLTAERTSFGPQGWDRLLGPHIDCHQVDGDHFTIMMLPKVHISRPSPYIPPAVH